MFKMIGREEEIAKLKYLIESPAVFPAMLIVGPPKSGKSALMSETIGSIDNVKSVMVSCMSATIRLADIFEDILKQYDSFEPCNTFAEFVQRLNKITGIKKSIIVLKNAERLRSIDQNLLPALLKLNELVDSMSISVALISKFPWSKWRLSQHLAAAPPVQIFIKPYTHDQLREILLGTVLKDDDEPQILKESFVQTILGVFQPICKTWPQFKRAAELLWPEYVKPTKDDPKVEPENSRSLYRYIEPHMRKVLTSIHYQESVSMMGEESKSKRLNVELPFFSKFLLLAAFLASYNPVSTDKRFFMKGKTGRVVKKSKRRQQAHQKSSQLLGPKMFDLNRMLAIFHVIVDQKVTSSAEIQSQVASLVTLQMLAQSGEDLDQPKYKCNVSLDFIRQIAKNVRFELHKYLYDVDY